MAMRRAATAERLYTVEEFEDLPEFGEGYELTDGRLVKMAGAGRNHNRIADNLRDAFKAFDPEWKLGEHLQDTSVILDPLKPKPNNTAIPDVAFWKASRNIKSGDIMPIPDLAVEIHSPRDVISPSALRSAMVKVTRLFNHGVPIVWVINPKDRIAEVYHLAQPKVPFKVLNEDEYLDGEDVIPGFKIKVGDLFKNMN